MKMARVIALLAFLQIGCSSDRVPSTPPSEDPPPGQPLYTSSALVTDTSITVSVMATNPESHSIRFVLRTPCTVVVRVYDSPDRTRTPVWDQEKFPGGCKSFPLQVDLSPGQVTTWTMLVRFRDVLAGQPDPNQHPLSPAHYYFDALVAQSQPSSMRVQLVSGNADVH